MRNASQSEPMTKEEAVQTLAKIGKSFSTPIDAHLKADEILLAVMRQYGLEDVVTAYRKCEEVVGGFWFEWPR